MLLADRAERGAGTRNVTPAAGLEAVSLGQGRAKDFDPLRGQRQEHPLDAKQALDENPLDLLGHRGLHRRHAAASRASGIYVDAKPDVAARAIEVVTPTAGWRGVVYVAGNGDAPDEPRRLTSA